MTKRRGEVIKVSALFEKYKTLLKAPQQSVIKEVVEVIHDVLGIRLTTSQFTYSVSSRTISLKLPSALKQQIKLHEKEILIHLKARLGEQNTPQLFL